MHVRYNTMYPNFLRPRVSLYTPENYSLQAKLGKKCQAAPQGCTALRDNELLAENISLCIADFSNFRINYFYLDSRKILCFFFLFF